ncbi:hypothetical protein D1159_06905 [Pseudoflavonifractor sp. 524-17]|uniref:hypothetical protein n=1 Tax=Pseudoflavonifractor sp. 524-17 TaxID=2304577 RepID=UPI001379E178|nr:hypothetical protein [Pseudoflavonifractor sp. 524-17]NCE64322.1 hypothetical protein [Pseudoflavonifractor sp. 524-17]
MNQNKKAEKLPLPAGIAVAVGIGGGAGTLVLGMCALFLPVLMMLLAGVPWGQPLLLRLLWVWLGFFGWKAGVVSLIAFAVCVYGYWQYRAALGAVGAAMAGVHMVAVLGWHGLCALIFLTEYGI